MPKQWEHHSLQRFLDCNPKSLLRVLEIYVADKPQVSQTCTKDTAEIFIKLVQEHFLSETLVPDNARTVLHAIQHICTYEDHTEGLPVLIAHGLLNKVVKHFTSKITYEPGDEYGDLYDEVLDTISSIADHSTDAKGKAVEAFGSVLLSILTSEKLSFLIRIEALKTLNILLVHCPWPIRDRFRDTPSHIKYIHKLGYLIPQIGDYEFQVGIIECLFRLTNKSNRAEFAAKWFTKGVQAAAFVKIRDSEFETDCRTFLNGLNKSESNRVYTVPCLSVRLGTYEVKKPDDPNYSQFWVDFNDGSKRISIFCCQDPTESQENEIDGMWETVSIFETNLVSYRLDKVGPSIKLSAVLHKNVRDLINFGPQFEDKRVQITFPGSIDVHTPVKRIFGLQKMTIDNQSCTQSTMTPSLHFEDSQGRHKAKKRKVSVPAEPMRTPTNRCIQQAGRAYPPIPMQPTPTRNTPNGQKSTKQDPSNTNTETREVSARRAAPVHTKPTRKVPENPIALPEHVQRGPLFSPTKAAKASIAAVAVKVRQSSDEVIPSSCPTENGVVIPDSQGKGIPLMPVPSETEIQEPNQMDVDHSDSDECDRSALKAGKKGKMAALKDYLQKTDPSYTSLPTNVHKVSNTPALSTVSEESAKTTPGRATASASVALGCIQEDEEGSLPRSQKSQTGSESVISASQNSNSNKTAAKRGKKPKVVSKKPTVQPQRRSQRGQNKEEQDQLSQGSVDVVDDSQRAEPLKASSRKFKAREKPASPEFKEPMTDKRNKKESIKHPGARTKGILKDTSRTERKTMPRDKTPEPKVSEVSRKDSPEVSSGGSQEPEIIESSQYNLGKSAGIGNIAHPAGMPPREPKFFKARYRERMASQNPQFWSPRSCLTNRAATPTKQKSPIRAHTQSVRDKTPVKQKTQGTKDNNVNKYSRFSEIHSKDSAPLSSIGSPVTESQDARLIHRKAPTPKVQSKRVKSPPRPQPPEVEPEEVYEFEPGVPISVNKKSANKRQVKKNEVQKNVSRTDTPSKSVHFGKGQNKAQNKNASRLLVDEGASAKPSSSHKPAVGKSKANSKPGKTKSQDNESKLAKRRRQALLSDEERFNTEEQESHQVSRGRDKTSDDEDDCVADMMELSLNILGGSRKEGTQRRKPKPVNYKEISDV